mgnify:CR=1 FL=1
MTARSTRSFAIAVARGLWPLAALGCLAVVLGGPAYDPYKAFTQQREAFLSRADSACLRELENAPPAVSVRGQVVTEDFGLSDACFRQVQSFRPKGSLTVSQSNVPR